MSEKMVPVDGHVHFHSLNRVALALDAADANFYVAGGGKGAGCSGMLLLTQAAGERVFEDLLERASCGAWMIESVREEPQSLIAQKGERWIGIACGRQVRCDNGLEVTALGTTLEFPDGFPLADTIGRVQTSGAIACLPWGFGKWTGKRGRQIRHSLDGNNGSALAVCDNGSRLQVLGQPQLIREAKRRGFKVLPGTDPFPLGADYQRTGSFGFLAAEPSRDRPWRDIADWLRTREDSPRPYGKALGPLRFLVNNVGIQLRNRLKRR